MRGKLFVGFISFFLILFSLCTSASVFAGNPPDQGKSTITSTAAPADGLTSSTVTIVLKDTNGNTLSSNDSILITSIDSTASFNPSSFTLDGSGTVMTHMKTTTVGNVQLMLTDVTTNNTRLTWAIPFYQPGTDTPTPTPTPNPNSCTDAAPGSTPQLTSAVSAGAHSITLTWTDASDPVSYYLLSYGLSSGNYIYGDPNIGGQGTTTFAVGGLTTGTKYYFVIRAVNGCTPGPFSNEVSGIAGVLPTPTPAPQDLSTASTGQSGVQPTDTPEISTDTPTPTPAGREPLSGDANPASASESNSFVSRVMLGATALGVVCVIVGAVLYLRMKKRST